MAGVHELEYPPLEVEHPEEQAREQPTRRDLPEEAVHPGDQLRGGHVHALQVGAQAGLQVGGQQGGRAPPSPSRRPGRRPRGRPPAARGRSSRRRSRARGCTRAPPRSRGWAKGGGSRLRCTCEARRSSSAMRPARDSTRRVEALQLGVLAVQLRERLPAPEHRAQPDLQLGVLHDVAQDLVHHLEQAGRSAPVEVDREQHGGASVSPGRAQATQDLAQTGFRQADVHHQEIGRRDVERVQALQRDVGLGLDRAHDGLGNPGSDQDRPGPPRDQHLRGPRHFRGLRRIRGSRGRRGLLPARSLELRGIALPRSGGPGRSAQDAGPGLHEGSTNL